jgi:hypothetical protein
MIDWGEVGTAGLVGGAAVGLVLFVGRGRRAAKPPPELPNPLADSPAVAATLAALAPQLGPGGTAGWLTVELGGERPAAEAIVRSLQPGLPEEGPFAVNRLVGHAPVRLTGQVSEGVAVVTEVSRLDVPDGHTPGA